MRDLGVGGAVTPKRTLRFDDLPTGRPATRSAFGLTADFSAPSTAMTQVSTWTTALAANKVYGWAACLGYTHTSSANLFVYYPRWDGAAGTGVGSWKFKVNNTSGFNNNGAKIAANYGITTTENALAGNAQGLNGIILANGFIKTTSAGNFAWHMIRAAGSLVKAGSTFWVWQASP